MDQFPEASSKDFAGAYNVLAVDSLMTKRAASAVAGLFGFCLPLFGQQGHRPAQTDLLTLKHLDWVGTALAAAQWDNFSTLNMSFRGSPALTLSDGELFSLSSAFNYAFRPGGGPVPLSVVDPQRANVPPMPGRDSSSKVVDLRPNFDYAGGEVGFLYGRSGGKYGGDFKQGYIIGEVGDDKFHITVGAAYQESSGRVPRFGR